MTPAELGQALGLLARSAGDEKRAGDPAISYGLKGKLTLSNTGWLLLAVPNALARGAFDALHEPGIVLPGGSAFNAHISVMRPEELEEIGGPDVVAERGKDFSYTLGPIRSVVPAGWSEMSRVWYIEVNSPELRKLRQSYGLSPLPKNNAYDFHITIAVRPKHAFKAAGLIHAWAKRAAVPENRPTTLATLREAKRQSDRRNYGDKHKLLRQLLAALPAEFAVDSTTSRFSGLTHVPTGFRLHAPTALVPADVRRPQ